MMQRFIKKPDIDMFGGIRVTKDTELHFENEHVTQDLKDLVFRSVTRIKGDGYESTYDTTIYMKEGDVLVYEEEGRGYIKPAEEVMTIKEAIEELKCIEDL